MTKMGRFVKLCLLVAFALLLCQREESLFSSMKPIMQAKEGDEAFLKLGWMKSTSAHTTGLDLHPEYLKGKCVAVRFRGSNATLSVDDAIEYMKAEKINSGTSKPLSLGLLFMDKPGEFISLGKGFFHLFHYLEFLIVSYEEMQRLAYAGDEPTLSSSVSSPSSTTSLSRGSHPIRVPWIYTPMLFKGEMCGVAGGINCLISDLILRASSFSSSSSSSSSSSWDTTFYGLESNDNYTRSMHPNFKGEREQRKTRTSLNISQDFSFNDNYERMQQEADAVLVVSRGECNKRSTNKLWADYIDDFPADKWHADVLAGLEKSADKKVATQPKSDKIVVGYVDRQNTRRTMPPREHEWLVGVLTDHPMIEFLHLHMEDYTSLEQIRIASRCHVLIGVHGNGLSHSLWMQPERYVVEIFWQFPFQFDYMTSAQLMRHKYMALFNGKAVDQELIRTRDKSLRKLPHKIRVTEQNIKAFTDEVEEGRQTLMRFLQKAMIEFGVR
jgi:hypothetical protein